MNFRSQFGSRPELIDDHPVDQADAPDRTVLTAVRTWLRPACGSARGGVHWRDILSGVGLRQDGIEHFDLLMRSLMHVSYRPLDMRCRCASELGKDEAVILQTIALLQKTHSGAALRMLSEWLPAPAVSGVLKLIDEVRPDVIVHTAAQPSHDRAAAIPFDDFDTNAVGTLNLLEAARRSCPEAPFVHMSTNKVYGDRPNTIALKELDTRWEYADAAYQHGIAEDFSIDQSKHSIFGASKVASDVMVQEYGRYFDMPTVCFRGGCLTGPNHAGAQLHGFLAFLMRCTVIAEPYTVIGYGGKQVRDNIHAADVASAFAAFHRKPRAGAVYNLGGGRHSHCSMLEAITLCERISGRSLDWTLAEQPRVGDHRWWISDLGEFRRDYPEWSLVYDLESTLQEIYERNAERWVAEAVSSIASG